MRSNPSIRAMLLVASLLVSPATTAANEWLTGAGAPTVQLGANNDLYLDLDTGRVFRKSDGTWINVGLLRAGALGMGPGWLSGSGSPTSGLGDEDDTYLDITIGRAFKKKSGTWLFLADLKGLQGLQGLKGDPGPPGPAGPTQGLQCADITTKTLPSGSPTGAQVEVCATTVQIAGSYVAVGNAVFTATNTNTTSGNAVLTVNCALWSGQTPVYVGTQTIRMIQGLTTGDGTVTVLGRTMNLATGSQIRMTCNRQSGAGGTLALGQGTLIAIRVAD